MKILWLNWKDLKNHLAGGAEVVTEELCKRLAADGHTVTLFASAFEGAQAEEQIDGYTVIRQGNRASVYWHAWRYYKKHMKGKVDLVIDEMNTMPFFATLYSKEPVILFPHQLAREIWFYNTPFPIAVIGYIAEALYLRFLTVFTKKVITVSESTKKDLMRFGFKEETIHIISEGIQMRPVEDLSSIKKFENPTILSLGRIDPMKRLEHILQAFEIAKKDIPNLELRIAGAFNRPYAENLRKVIKSSQFSDSIILEGRVDDERKALLMQRSHVLAVTSIKEGWCLVVTEAASQGTPAAVYNVDGLRDSVRNNETGLITSENSPTELAVNITKFLQNKDDYERLRINSWQWSKEITFKRSYHDFYKILKK